MAKDPAVLWYYKDYLSGTEEMGWSEQGAYARLLNKQADKGHLSIETIKKILKKDFEKLWSAISSKFLVDAEGFFYNERMDIECEKRRKHSASQSENARKRWEKNGICDGIATAMPLVNANANVNSFGGAGGEKIHIGIEKVAEVAGEVFRNQRWVENICMGQQLSIEALKKWMAQFNASICNDSMPDFDQGKYQKLFGGWLNRQKAKGYSLNALPSSNGGAPPVKKI